MFGKPVLSPIHKINNLAQGKFKQGNRNSAEIDWNLNHGLNPSSRRYERKKIMTPGILSDADDFNSFISDQQVKASIL